MRRILDFSLSAPMIAGWLFLSGCAAPEHNPNSPRANTGYVDFYTESNLDLSWEVKRFDPQTDKPRTVYSRFDPAPANVIRLASPAGNQKFQVWFLNRATKGPQVVPVQVEDGKVTPVHIVLTKVGSTSVEQETQAVRGSAKGYGRRKKFTAEINRVYEIGALAQAPLDYRTKEQMPYWSAAKK